MERGREYHSRPVFYQGQEKQRKHDAEEGKYMEKNGWKLLLFWEHDIKRDLTGCVLKVQEVM